jgi:hypothetical protein
VSAKFGMVLAGLASICLPNGLATAGITVVVGRVFKEKTLADRRLSRELAESCSGAASVVVHCCHLHECGRVFLFVPGLSGSQFSA